MTIKQRAKMKSTLEEIEKYEEADRILSNYDSKFDLRIWTLHNDNTKNLASITLPITGMTHIDIAGMISKNLSRLKRNIDKMMSGDWDIDDE